MGKAFEKQTKAIEDQAKKQVDALKDLKPNIQESTIKVIIPEDVLNDEAKNELNKIKETEKTVEKENFIYRASKYTYSFKTHQIIKKFYKGICNREINLKKTDDDQSNLFVKIMNFNKKSKTTRSKEKARKKRYS